MCKAIAGLIRNRCMRVLGLFLFCLFSLPALADGKLFSISAGNGLNQVFNDVMEGGIPYGPVSAATLDDREYFIAEPVRKRVGVFDSSGVYLRQIVSPEFYGLKKLMPLKAGYLAAVVSSGNENARAMIFKADGTLVSVLEPALMIYDDRRVLDFEVHGSDRIIAILDRGALLYRFDGEFLASPGSSFLDSDSRVYSLEVYGESEKLVIEDINGELIGSWPVKRAENFQYVDNLLNLNGNIYILRQPVPRGEQGFILINPLDGRVVREGSIRDLPADSARQLRIVCPYPKGDVEIHEL
jgi:hypothetical protein